MTASNRNTPNESRAVEVWRRELADDIVRLDSTLDGLAARMTALDKNKATIENATLEQLNRLDKRLNDIVGNGRYEGVDYEDENEPADLAARCAALGYELIVTDKGEQFVIETHTSPRPFLEVVFMHRNDNDDDLEDWIADQEQVSERVRRAPVVQTAAAEVSRKQRGPSEAFAASACDEIDALDRARDNAQTVVYDVRFLVEAALKLNTNGADDGPIEQVLKAAKEKLVALANDLDSVKFGRRS